MRRINNHVNIDDQETGRWLISYADFITLLFAFFVVMYSISQVNVSQYKVLSQSLKGAFDILPRGTEVIPVGEPSLSLQAVTGDDIDQPEVNADALDNGQIDSENFASSEDFKDLENGLKASLGDLIDQQLAEINTDANWINIVLKSALLFPSGSASLNTESEPLMEEVSKHLNKNLQLILVHGHTDNIPINTLQFPSNWELSSARGVAVVRKLQSLGVQPNRLSVEGHGEYRPVSSNDNAQGRRKNRRVVIAISRKQQAPVLLTKTFNQDNKLQTLQPENNSQGDAGEKNIQKEVEPTYEIIKLPGGGILIRDKKPPQNDEGN